MKKKITSFITVIVILAIIICAVVYYMHSVNEIIRQMIMTNISELTEHDVKTVEGRINSVWSELYGISDRLVYYNCTTIYDMEDHLAVEKASIGLEELIMVDTSGNAYFDVNRIFPPEEHNIQNYFDENPDGLFVAWDEQINNVSSNDEATANLLYGVAIEPIEIEGVTFIGIVGQAKTTDIREQMQIESFDGLGNSRIVDANGNYIVIPSLYLEDNKYSNIFDAMQEDLSLGEAKMKEMRKKFDNREMFNLSYKNADNQRMTYVFQPIEISGVSGWYYITQISGLVLDNQSRIFLLINAIQIIFVSIVILVFMLLAFSMRSKTHLAQAEAKARSEFLSNMSHEIRTPINGIIGLNHQMSANINDSERMEKYLSQMNVTAEYLLSLVNDILDVSKLQAKKLELDKAPMSLNFAIDSVCFMEKEVITKHNINFEKDIQITNDWIIEDELRIRQVLMNLLNNAVKFTPSGGNIALKVRQTQIANNCVETVFQVIDNGCGISVDFQKHIFESFSQERSKNNASQKGTGLGLSISYMIAKQMDGSLTVESELEKGSTFTFTMPAQITDPISENSPDNAQSQTDLSSPKRSLRVLVAEDNELNGEILMEILNDAGHGAEWAHDGSEAVKLFEESDIGHFDVILMDIQMPGINGYDAAKIIRSLDRDDAESVCIFACTANSFKEDKEKAYQSGMNDFLAKPIDIDMMMKKLGRAVE